MSVETLPARAVVGISFGDDPYAARLEVAANEVHLLEHALHYAEVSGAELRFVSCIEAVNEPIPDHDKWTHDILRERLGQALERLCQDAAERGVRASGVVVEGAPPRQLIAQAAEFQAGLIIVAPRKDGRSTLDRFLHGSTAERLLRHAESAVWIVHADAAPPVRRVLVPVDFSPTSERCVQIARRMYEVWKVEVILLHAIEYPREIALRRLPSADDAIRAYREEVHSDVAGRMDTLLGGDRSWCRVLLSHDWVVRALPEMVVRDSVDLVIMGSVGRSGVTGFFIGNTAEKLFRVLQCSTWVVKPKDWKAPA
jgi:universal stress protein E